ncbi:MAG: FAD-dependent oxidoreductase [Paracoccaceae bacterium]|jgi:D-amino-acid dehydrogenase|nr:FAD-dependent oxidoreductase [Paracoccaceae bacterium]
MPDTPAPSAAPRHVAVIGAGIVGVATALELARGGTRVTLVDRDGPAAGASRGNGGVLAASAVVPVTVPGLIRAAPRLLASRDGPLFLRWRYLPRLAPWLARYLSHANATDAARTARALAPLTVDSLDQHRALAAGTPAERYVVPSDYLYLYRNAAAFRADSFGWALRREAGFDWDEMGREELAAYDPMLARAAGFGVRLGGHGRISDPGAYVEALAAEAERRGATILRAEVDAIVAEAGRVSGLRLRTQAGAETLFCDAAVVTTGAWSGPLARRLGLDVPLETERGYHLELVAPSAMPRATLMVSAGKFVATPMEGRLRLAGIVEFGGLGAGPSPAPFDLLRRQARRAFPDLRWQGEREWMGHRPATADSLPVVGAAPGLAGAWLGFGHHHVGLTAGPKTGRLLARLVAGDRPNLDLSTLSPARFARKGAARPV